MNYRACGMNCGVGGIEFTPPRPSTGAAVAETTEAIESEAVHAVPAYRPRRCRAEALRRIWPRKRHCQERPRTTGGRTSQLEPTAGNELERIGMNDPRWPALGWLGKDGAGNTDRRDAKAPSLSITCATRLRVKSTTSKSSYAVKARKSGRTIMRIIARNVKNQNAHLCLNHSCGKCLLHRCGNMKFLHSYC